MGRLRNLFLSSILLLSSLLAPAYAGVTLGEDKSQYTVTVNGVPKFFFGSDAEFQAVAKMANLKVETPTDRIQCYLNYHRFNVYSTTPTLFKNTFWTTKRTEAVSANSPAFVAELVRQITLAPPWVNNYSYSTPVYFVENYYAKSPVNIVDWDGTPLIYTALYNEFQKGIPMPTNPRQADGDDGTLTIVDVDTKKLYEFFAFRKVGNQYFARWGGVLNNVEVEGVMPTPGGERWGATGSGLPAAGGTILYKEAKAGRIDHTVAIALPITHISFVRPATASDGTADGLIPEGTIFKFPANIVIDPSWCSFVKMVVIAGRDYGFIVRDKTSYNVVIYAEDLSLSGGDAMYVPFRGGMEWNDVVKQIPWNLLEALEPIAP